MADFKRIGQITPGRVSRLSITLVRQTAPEESFYRATYDIDVLMSDGSIKPSHGDLINHITAAERAALINFIDTLQARAEAQIL